MPSQAHFVIFRVNAMVFVLILVATVVTILSKEKNKEAQYVYGIYIAVHV